MSEKTITLPEEDWHIIDQALQRMPYGQVVGLYRKINDQLMAQASENDRQAEAVQHPTA